MDRVIGKVFRCPLEATEMILDGLQQAKCAVPHGSQILSILSEPPDNIVSLFVVAPDLGREYTDKDLGVVEFGVAYPGDTFPPDGYMYRGPVRGPSGVMFIFEKKVKSRILVPATGGVG